MPLELTHNVNFKVLTLKVDISLENKIQNELAVEELNRCLDEIPENFRIAVVLRDFQELSYQEISKILEIPIGTIKSRINRGRIQLAEKLKHFKE